MRFCLIIVFVLVFFSNSCSCKEDKGLDNSLNDQVEEMKIAVLEKKHNIFLKYMHPKIISEMGGKENVIQNLEKGLGEGNEFVDVQIIKSGKFLNFGIDSIQCTLEQKMKIAVPNGFINSTSSLIGITYNGGKNWYFIDTGNNDLQTLKQYFPELDNKLDIKAQTKPVFSKQ